MSRFTVKLSDKGRLFPPTLKSLLLMVNDPLKMKPLLVGVAVKSNSIGLVIPFIVRFPET